MISGGDTTTNTTTGDYNRDGLALIGDPDMGFENLRQFGPTLVHHTQLKIRSNTNNSNFILVDFPGMIDSPMFSSNMGGDGGTNQKLMDRGYDFAGVVRWFAERADVVLLFFDPDKPGTTGETLSILLKSLSGMDHKLLIVLNKADQFENIHDFARAYGSLCWNLSKVIPRIYIMCLPVEESSSLDALNAGGVRELSMGLEDLYQSRRDVVEEMMKAPLRRLDNAISHLTDCVRLLRLCAFVGAPLPVTGGLLGVGALSIGSLQYSNSVQLSRYGIELTNTDGLAA
mmetsp:Transcript_5014/g.5687  ORF Transcript_5014/g.5687 Transcript_5014/m.5687 type:complete len:286 (+) Transcript_5014:72-929(+)